MLITHDPGDWFDETLRSLAAQTYPSLSVLVVDTASAVDPTDAVLAVLPEAHVHRLDHDPGFGAAANEAATLVEGAAFFAFLHDDVALEPDAIRSLVEEAFRSNAGIIGPKLVEWDDPRRLLQVGMSADKTGALASLTERGELDQEQHDAIRDVFVIPGGCTIVRTDLFSHIGGFDDGIVGLGDDLDLCWRAHVAGARVLIAPVTRVRHLEARGLRHPVDDRRAQAARHRLRSSLISYGRWHRIRVLPQALLFTLVEALYALIAGRPGQARDVLGAWTWNLRRMGAVRARRKQVRAFRTVSDREVRSLQVGGSARLSAFLRGQVGTRDDRVTTVAQSTRDVAGALREGSRQFTSGFAVLLGILLLIGSRDLLFGGIPAIGEFARMPAGPGDLLSSWWSGWRRAGLGSAGSQPTGTWVLGVLGYVAIGAMGVLRTVLILATLPIGAIGAWRLAKPIGSARASVTAFAVYLAIPIPYNAIARGSWSGLLVYALSPWMLLALGRASGAAPFGPGNAEADEPAATTVRWSMARLVLGLGLGLALVATLVPFAVVVVVGVAAALTVGSILCFRVVGLGRMLAVAIGSAALALALNVPWSLDLIRGPSPWESIAGISSSNTAPLSIGEILRFETGPWGAPPLGWAFLLAGALPVIIGRSWRLEWAVRAWIVIVAGWVALWANQHGYLPGGLPPAEVVLAPVAAALALAAALGLSAFEIDLRAYRFGWRQMLAVAAAIGVVLGAAPLASGLLDGRWRTPTTDYLAGMAPLLEETDAGGFRVMWLGDPEVLPARGWRYDEQLAYVTTDQGSPTALERFVVPQAGPTPQLRDAVVAAQDRRTNRLGRLLGPMGVRYLVVQRQLAPGTDAGEQGRGVVPVLDALEQQLDLEQVPVAEGITVYRNLAWVPTPGVLPEREGERTSWTDAAADDLAAAVPALTEADGAVGSTGEVTEAGELLLASSIDERWRLQVDGVRMARGEAYGWANEFQVTRTGAGTLSYDTSAQHRIGAVLQAVLWLLVFWAWRRARARDRVRVLEARAAAPRRRPDAMVPPRPLPEVDDEPLFVDDDPVFVDAEAGPLEEGAD